VKPNAIASVSGITPSKGGDDGPSLPTESLPIHDRCARRATAARRRSDRAGEIALSAARRLRCNCRRVRDEFIARLAGDEQKKRFFIGFSDDSKMRIRQHLVDFICKAAGVTTPGRDMKTAHAGSGVTKADWDRSLKIFGEVLAKFKVPDKEQHELAAMLTPLEKDIVEK
jgi:hemoglobin